MQQHFIALPGCSALSETGADKVATSVIIRTGIVFMGQ
jgi:hypothetical protein